MLNFSCIPLSSELLHVHDTVKTHAFEMMSRRLRVVGLVLCMGLLLLVLLLLAPGLGYVGTG